MDRYVHAQWKDYSLDDYMAEMWGIFDTFDDNAPIFGSTQPRDRSEAVMCARAANLARAAAPAYLIKLINDFVEGKSRKTLGNTLSYYREALIRESWNVVIDTDDNHCLLITAPKPRDEIEARQCARAANRAHGATIRPMMKALRDFTLMSTS